MGLYLVFQDTNIGASIGAYVVDTTSSSAALTQVTQTYGLGNGVWGVKRLGTYARYRILNSTSAVKDSLDNGDGG